MKKIERIKKIISKIFTFLFLFLSISYCNTEGSSTVLKGSILSEDSSILISELFYSSDYAFANEKEDIASFSFLAHAKKGKYKFYLHRTQKERQVLILKFIPQNVYAQVFIDGKLEFSNFPNTLDSYILKPYIPIPVSDADKIRVEIYVYPFKIHSFLNKEIDIGLLSYKEFVQLSFLRNFFCILILVGFLLTLLVTNKKIIITSSALWLCYYSCSQIANLLGFSNILEFLIEHDGFFKFSLALSQILILKYVYNRIKKSKKFFLFPVIGAGSLLGCFTFDVHTLTQENFYIVTYYLLQNLVLSLRANYIVKRNIKYLLDILNSYKRELQLIRGDFLRTQNEFYRKILDKSFHLVTYMEKLEIQTNEMETLNQLIIQLLEENNIDHVLDTIFEHLHTYYKADITFLYFIDPETNEFYAYRGSTRNVPKEINEFMLTVRMPLSKEAGYSYLAYKRKKIIYKENTKTKYKRISELSNSKITYLPEVLSSLYIPIVIRDEFQGIFFLASFNHSMNLNKEKLKYISMFTNQVASAIQKQKILQEMEREKQNVELERQKAERAKITAEEAIKEIEAINSLAKDINENLDLKFIMSKIMEFVEQQYSIRYYSLYFVNNKKTKVKLLDAKFPNEITPQIRKKISEIEFPLNVEKGAHAFIYKSQKMIYFKTLGTTHISKEEGLVLNYLNIASMIGIPLKLRGEIIGILSFYSSQKLKLTKRQLKTIAALGEHVAGAIHNSRLYKEIQQEKDKSDNLLLSILPPKIAVELKNKGKVIPVFYDSASILFTDFVGFTKIAEKLKPEQLLIELDGYFTYFDFICERFNLEKLKTIGDSYMCAGGLPNINNTHPLDACLASMEFRDFTLRMQDVAKVSKEGTILWELRIGIHTGPLIGGVIGTTKFAFDVWGDSVNIASRIESSGQAGKINISEATYELVKDFFICEYRGKIPMKNRGSMGMYFLCSLKPEYSANEEGTLPNQKFWEVYEKLKAGEISLGESLSVNSKLAQVR